MFKKDDPIPKWIAIPVSIFSWISAVIVTIVLSTVGLVFVLPVSMIRDHGTRRLLHRVAVHWARTLIVTNPLWRLQISGLENLPQDRKYVIVCNHQSLLDILVVLAGLPVHFKFMAKQELFDIPFIGWQMAAAGYIPILRKSKDSGRKAVLKAREWLKKGVSVLMFPEGTRSLDGNVGLFKMGAFKVARDENADLLPVVISGTGDAVPKKSIVLKKYQSLSVHIMTPVRTDRKNDDEIRELADQIRNQMIETLAQL